MVRLCSQETDPAVQLEVYGRVRVHPIVIPFVEFEFSLDPLPSCTGLWVLCSSFRLPPSAVHTALLSRLSEVDFFCGTP